MSSDFFVIFFLYVLATSLILCLMLENVHIFMVICKYCTLLPLLCNMCYAHISQAKMLILRIILLLATQCFTLFSSVSRNMQVSWAALSSSGNKLAFKVVLLLKQ